jgi:quinohemoprotein ethanol dehydrogenase
MRPPFSVRLRNEAYTARKRAVRTAARRRKTGSVIRLALIVGLGIAGVFYRLNSNAADGASGVSRRDDIASAGLLPDGDARAWVTGGGDWRQTYYSPLSGIDPSNVAILGYAWSYDLHTTHGLEATPVVVDGVMYASAPWGYVYAVDARTGKGLWSFDPRPDFSMARKLCCDVVNRGLALAGERVFVAAPDGRLFALDRRTGKELWHVDTIVDHSRGYSVTGGVYVANDLAVVGNSGSEYDARGYVSAYDIRDGKLRWRFFTVPANAHGPFESPELKAAARTWDPHSLWDAGGGGTVWNGMAYDPALKLLYFGTGNAEVYLQKLRSPRGGDNLYTCSIVAVHAETGKMAWYYQEVPGDQWDFDSDAPIILADLNIGGHPRKVLLQAPKDGFFYVLDRISGRLLSAEPYVPVTWASRVERKTGRPSITGRGDYSAGPRLVFPSISGGHNWQPMSFNPNTGLVYIPTIEASSVFWLPAEPFVYVQGSRNMGVNMAWPARNAGEAGLESKDAEGLPPLAELARGQPDTTVRGFLRAWDPVANRMVWQVETSDQWVDQLNAQWNGGGVMTTAGGLVFQGRSTGYLYVYRADNGQQVTAINVGTSIMAAPVTYELDGVQYVSVMAGFGGGLGRSWPEGTAASRYGNAGRIVTFKLGGGSVPLPHEVAQLARLVQPLVDPFGTVAVIDRGRALFARNCRACHTNEGNGGAVPDLRHMNAETHAAFDDIVLKGIRASKGMGSFADILSAEDVKAIHASLVDDAWREYEKHESQRNP